MIKRIIRASILIIPLVFANAVMAHTTTSSESSMCTSCSYHTFMGKMTTQLHLTNAQIAQIDAIKAKSREELKASRHQLKALKSQIRHLITANTINEPALDKLIKEKSDLMASITKARFLTKHQIYKVLTLQQQEQYKEMTQQWEEKSKHHSACQCHANAG